MQLQIGRLYRVAASLGAGHIARLLRRQDDIIAARFSLMYWKIAWA